MKKSLLLLTLLFVLTPVVNAGTLKFRNDNTFKIVQFTDLHYIHGNDDAKAALENVNAVLEMEKPDLVIVTGDLIFGGPAELSFRDVMKTFEKHNIPFAFTFGNHDDEYGMSRQELLNLGSQYSHNLSSTTPGITGTSNYVLEVKSSASDKVEELLYVFDSNTYAKHSGLSGIDGYEWIYQDQIAWYCGLSEKYAASNSGKPVPSLAFFHIPLPEFAEAAENQSTFLVGTRWEACCCPKINTGLFAAMFGRNDVKGIFCGHDHNNDYTAIHHGVALCYGRYSGANTVYNNLKPNGARVIILKEGSREFTTYLRLSNGQKLNEINIQ